MSEGALLVGGSGALAHSLAAEWLGSGGWLRALCRPGESAGLREWAGQTGFRGVAEGAPVDAATLRAALSERPEVCFCLPSSPGAGGAGTLLRDTFVEWMGALVELLEACRAHGTRLVYVSSAEVLDSYHGRGRQGEGWPVAPRTPRAAALVAGEQLVLSYDRSYGMPVTVCRTFHVYGPAPAGSDTGVVTMFARRAARGERLEVHGDGRQSRDLVHARDVARLLAGLGAEPRLHGRVVHAASGEETRIVDLARLMSPGVGFELVTHPSPLAEVGRERGDASLALKLAGWRPGIGLREGLREMRAWAAGQVGRDRSMRTAS
jgi:UDP-glucose 4-epimerase